MYRVLLVEDEIFVREGIKSLIDWGSIGFSICGEASHGKEALKILQKESFDVIITDIKMPEMNGLELIEEINKRFSQIPKIIIISGYNEFEFARTALKYNVKNYILKPLDELEIIETMKKVSDEINKDKQEKVQNDKYRLLNKNNEFLKYLEKSDSIDINYLLDNDFRKDKNNLVMLSKVNKNDKYDIDNLLYNLVYNLKQAEKGNINLDIFCDHNLNIYFFAKSKTLNNLQIIEKIYRYLTNNIQEDITIIYETIDDISKIRNTCNKLLKLLDYLCFYEKTGIFNSNEINCFIQIAKLDEKSLINNTIKNIEQNNVSKIKEDVTLFIDKCFQEKISIEVIRGYINLVIIELLEYFQIYDFELDEFLAVFDEKSSKKKVINTLNDLCLKILEIYKNQIQNSNNAIIKKIERYINENFSKDITIKEMSREFYMNPIYLGQLFKKQFGMNFNKYLHTIRVEMAKRMLTNSNKKVYEIAKEVGYKDPEYFSMKFEEVTGMTPSNYRNQKTR
ncbi:response regulator [Caldicellulosiruptoraceae bacterium PP1]